MLVIESKDRYSIQKIQQNKWYIEGYENESTQQAKPVVITNEQHEEILKEMEEMGFERALITKSINDDVYDYLAATFYLLTDKKFRHNKPLIVKEKKKTGLDESNKSKEDKGKDVKSLVKPIEEETNSKPIVKPKKTAESRARHQTSPTPIPIPLNDLKIILEKEKADKEKFENEYQISKQMIFGDMNFPVLQ